MEGYIYIIKSDSFKTPVIKIGLTKNPWGRVSSSNTYVPNKFKFEFIIKCINIKEAENNIFDKLKIYRSSNGEFFNVDLEYAILIVKNIVENINKNIYINKNILTEEDLFLLESRWHDDF